VPVAMTAKTSRQGVGGRGWPASGSQRIAEDLRRVTPSRSRGWPLQCGRWRSLEMTSSEVLGDDADALQEDGRAQVPGQGRVSGLTISAASSRSGAEAHGRSSTGSGASSSSRSWYSYSSSRSSGWGRVPRRRGWWSASRRKCGSGGGVIDLLQPTLSHFADKVVELQEACVVRRGDAPFAWVFRRRQRYGAEHPGCCPPIVVRMVRMVRGYGQVADRFRRLVRCVRTRDMAASWRG
jgi:hypothetical protein